MKKRDERRHMKMKTIAGLCFFGIVILCAGIACSSNSQKSVLVVTGTAGDTLQNISKGGENSFYVMSAKIPQSAQELTGRNLLVCSVDRNTVIDLIVVLTSSPEQWMVKTGTTLSYSISENVTCPDSGPCITSTLTMDKSSHIILQKIYGNTTTLVTLRSTCLAEMQNNPNLILLAPRNMDFSEIHELTEIVFE